MAVTVDDRIAIGELSARYYSFIDAKDLEGALGLLMPAVTFHTNLGDFIGREAFKKFMENRIAEGHEDGARHYVTNHIIDGHQEGARYRYYVMKVNIVTGPAVIATASADTIVIKSEKGWRFLRLIMKLGPAMFEAE